MVNAKNGGYSPKNEAIEDMLISLGGDVIGKIRGARKTNVSHSDISISRGAKTDKVCVTIRNGYEAKFGEYISFIKFNDCVYLITPQSKTMPKIKVTRQARKDGTIHGYVFAHKDMLEVMRELAGDYDLLFDKKIGAYYIEITGEVET